MPGRSEAAVGFSPESRNFRHRVHDARLAAQLVEQRLRVLQVACVEALSKLTVDFTEHRARFVVSDGSGRAVAHIGETCEVLRSLVKMYLLHQRDEARLFSQRIENAIHLEPA
jgi:hypothetical protein